MKTARQRGRLRKRDATTLSSRTSVSLILLLVLAVVAITALYWRYILLEFPPVADAPAFGDQFGGLNTLFSGLAFSIIAYTMWLQRTDLVMQAEQLADAQQEQERSSYRTLFFQLLGLFKESARAMRAPASRRDGEAVPALDGVAVFGRFRQDFFSDSAASFSMKELLARWQLSDLFHSTEIWAYAQNLGLVLSLLDLAPNEDRALYGRILQSQLSDDELVWIFCFTLTPVGSQTHKPLVRKHRLLADWPAPRKLAELWQAEYGPEAKADQPAKTAAA